MQTKFIFLALFFLSMGSCEKDGFDLKDPDTEQFVSLLKHGAYREKVGSELPDFAMDDIGRLLNYVDDTARLAMFPANPISSKYTDPKILNECLLWTIEGIRLGKKYPSLEPVLIDTSMYSGQSGYRRLKGTELLEIADRYRSWYQAYTDSPSEVLKRKDLLEGTPYKWN